MIAIKNHTLSYWCFDASFILQRYFSSLPCRHHSNKSHVITGSCCQLGFALVHNALLNYIYVALILFLAINNCDGRQIKPSNINENITNLNYNNTQIINEHQIKKRDLYPNYYQNQQLISSGCSNDAECHQFSLNSICIIDENNIDDNKETKFICICSDGYVISNNTCVAHNNVNEDASDETTEPPKSSKTNTQILPIMIVLGIMFVGMCVALNLFSRARFRNNRSIFSNPRLIKLGQSKSSGKRRKSPPHPNVTSIRLIPGLATADSGFVNSDHGNENREHKNVGDSNEKSGSFSSIALDS